MSASPKEYSTSFSLIAFGDNFPFLSSFSRTRFFLTQILASYQLRASGSVTNSKWSITGGRVSSLLHYSASAAEVADLILFLVGFAALCTGLGREV